MKNYDYIILGTAPRGTNWSNYLLRPGSRSWQSRVAYLAVPAPTSAVNQRFSCLAPFIQRWQASNLWVVELLSQHRWIGTS